MRARPERGAPSQPVRLLWVAAGLFLVAVGAVGLVLPGLPSTVFFVAAAWCFSRSSRRLERWMLGLPVVGRLIQDYRAGLGMPRRSKIVAVGIMWTAITVSAGALREYWWLPVLTAGLGIVGTVVLVWRVPTRERVLATRETVTDESPRQD
jgi:uncharacterized membrane protein YbaN (DUF454 family)